MPGGGFPIPTREEQARDRLESALSRLESAIRNNQGADTSATAFADELSAARGEITTLKSTNKMVSNRLDKAIDKMKAILGS